MEKRLFLAIALSLLILLSWSTFTSKFYPIENKEVTAVNNLTATLPANVATLSAPGIALENTSAPEQGFDFDRKETGYYFLEPQAAIKELVFKKYQKSKFSLQYGFLYANEKFNFKKIKDTPQELIFSYSDDNLKISKKFNFISDYELFLEITVNNLSTSKFLKLNYPLLLGIIDFSDSKTAPFQDVFIKTPEKSSHLNGQKSQGFQNIEFAGLRNRYFCLIADPDSANSDCTITKLNGKMSKLELVNPEVNLAPGENYTFKVHIYLGPQNVQLLNAINPGWSSIVHFGTFDLISQIILQMLELINKVVRNWGWAIIVLSVLVYLILYPLTLKQMRSMKEMQALQPKIESLRVLYKDNPQRLNKETMELYREHKVNPFGGCLPLVLQMPIFFALYQALMRSVSLKGAEFFWIKDLSEPDRLFYFPTTIPFIGNEFNLLPIIMAIGMFFQQKMTMATSGSSTSAEQQKIMSILFPILFGFIFYHMPSGLVLYWLVNSALTVIYQLKVTKSK